MWFIHSVCFLWLEETKLLVSIQKIRIFRKTIKQCISELLLCLLKHL